MRQKKGMWKEAERYDVQSASQPALFSPSLRSIVENISVCGEGQLESELQVRSQARALDQFSVGCCPLDKLTRLRIRLRLPSGQLLLPVPVCSPHVPMFVCGCHQVSCILSDIFAFRFFRLTADRSCSTGHVVIGRQRMLGFCFHGEELLGGGSHI